MASQFAAVTSEKVCEFLKDAVLDVADKDPVVRPAFLKGNILTDESAYTKNPEYTFVGKLLANLLEDSPKEFETVIEVNLLKATSNVVNFLTDLQTEKPFFLVDLCRKCLEDVVLEIGGKDISPEDAQIQIMKEFTLKSTDLIFDIAFPNGANGLILPDLGGINFILRPVLWNLVKEVIDDQIGEFLGDLQGKTDLKNLLMIEGYTSLMPFIGTKPQNTGIAQRAAKITVETGQALTFAPIGFVYIFLKLIMTSIVSVFQRTGVPKIKKENAYVDQGSFNAHLKTLIDSIVQDTDSKLLKFVANRKLSGFIDEWGPVIVEAIREINFLDILNDQLQSVVSSVVSPGGSWEGKGVNQTYKTAPIPFPKTLQEQEKKEENAKIQEQARAEHVENLQKQLGENIDGLLHEITEGYAVKHSDFTDEELKSATSRQKLAKKLHSIWASFANACIYRIVRIAAFVLGVRSKIKSTSKVFHEKLKRVHQEEFLLAIGEFERKELRDYTDSQVKKKPPTS